MSKGISNTLKRACVSILIVMLVITMMPFTSSDYEAYAAFIRGTFHYGSTVKDSNGRSYHWADSMMAPAYWWDANGNRITDQACTYESASAGMEYYTIKSDGKTYKGYCVVHGIRVDTTTNLSGKTSLDSWTHTKAYPESSKRGIEHALLYGYQDDRTISQLEKSGFENSKWYKKHATKYSTGDWYMATQILVWEYQQLIRTDSISGGHGRQGNGLVSANHYYNVVKGRAAEDIYNFMANCIKNHKKVASFAWAEKQECEEKSKGWRMTKDETTGYYTVTLTDKNKLEGLKASGTSKNKWEVKKNGSKYTFIYKGKTLPEDGIVFKFSKKIYLQDELKNSGLFIWSWSAAGSLWQAVASGVKDDPVPMYIKFYASDDPPPPPPGEENPKPEPEFFPTFEFPVEKVDLNPGWDGDTHTGMGDASLAATYTLYRSLNDGDWEEVDSVTLDEYGSQEILSDQPRLSVDDFTATDSGSYTHVEPGDSPTTHCTVEPTRTEWTANVKYKVVETRPDERFIEPDSGIRDTYEADYYAVTNNSQTCTANPENWSDIEYTLTYSDDTGTNETKEGKLDEGDIESNGSYSFSEETFVNDSKRNPSA